MIQLAARNVQDLEQISNNQGNTESEDICTNIRTLSSGRLSPSSQTCGLDSTSPIQSQLGQRVRIEDRCGTQYIVGEAEEVCHYEPPQTFYFPVSLPRSGGLSVSSPFGYSECDRLAACICGVEESLPMNDFEHRLVSGAFRQQYPDVWIESIFSDGNGNYTVVGVQNRRVCETRYEAWENVYEIVVNTPSLNAPVVRNRTSASIQTFCSSLSEEIRGQFSCCRGVTVVNVIPSTGSSSLQQSCLSLSAAQRSQIPCCQPFVSSSSLSVGGVQLTASAQIQACLTLDPNVRAHIPCCRNIQNMMITVQDGSEGSREEGNRFKISNQDGLWFMKHTPHRKKLDILLITSYFSSYRRTERLSKDLERLINSLQSRGIDWQMASISSYYYSREPTEFQSLFPRNRGPISARGQFTQHILNFDFLSTVRYEIDDSNYDGHRQNSVGVSVYDAGGFDVARSGAISGPLYQQLLNSVGQCNVFGCAHRPLFHLLNVLSQSREEEMEESSLVENIRLTRQFFRSEAELAIIFMSNYYEGSFTQNYTGEKGKTFPIEIQNKIVEFKTSQDLFFQTHQETTGLYGEDENSRHLYTPDEEYFTYNNNWKEKKISLVGILPNPNGQGSCEDKQNLSLLREFMGTVYNKKNSNERVPNVIFAREGEGLRSFEVDICSQGTQDFNGPSDYFGDSSRKGLFNIASVYPLLSGNSHSEPDHLFFGGTSESGEFKGKVWVTYDRKLHIRFFLDHVPEDEASLQVKRVVTRTNSEGEMEELSSTIVPNSEYVFLVENEGQASEQALLQLNPIPTYKIPMHDVEYIVEKKEEE